MSDFSNITVTENEDGQLSLSVAGKPISEKYSVTFEPGIVDELKALVSGQSLKLFDQFIFSHTDLNFEHSYRYVTSMIREEDENYRVATSFVYRITAESQEPFEHVITRQGQPMSPQDIYEFIQAHMLKSLNDYTDLAYAY